MGKKRNPRFQTRMEALENEINKQISRIQQGTNTELLEIIYLYYHFGALLRLILEILLYFPVTIDCGYLFANNVDMCFNILN